MANPLFKTKSIERLKQEAHTGEGGLKRTLNAFNLTALGVGAIIGAGIFTLVGEASQMAGPAIILSFLLAALGCGFAGLCYAEFSSMIPVAGSAYVYAYATLGELVAFVIGWALTLEYAFGASTVAVGWSGYVVSFLKDFGLQIPPEFTSAAGQRLVDITDAVKAAAIGIKPGWVPMSEDLTTSALKAGVDLQTLPQVTALFNIPAVLIIGLITIILVRGISESAKVNNVIVIIKTVVILTFIIAGIWFVQADNFVPFIPENTGEFGKLGWSGILAGASTIFFAYIGFDAVSTAAQECKNPEKDMPIGILSSLLICTIIYVLVAYVLIGLVPYKQLGVPDPIAVGINAVPQLAFLKPFIKIGAIAGLTSVILVMMLGQSRIFYSMGKDGLLTSKFAEIHPKFQTPHIPTIITGIGAATLAGLLPIGTLGHMVAFGTLLAFTIVCVGVLILRYTRPEIPRPFKTPLVPVVPVLGALISLGLMYGLSDLAKQISFGWLVLGLIIYFTYSKRHSKLNNPSA